MAWITISKDDVLEKITDPEMEAIQDVALGANQPDPVPETIISVCDEVRGYIAACPRNPLGIGYTIPQKLREAALSLVVFRIASRLPTKVLVTEERVQAKNDAIALLRDVARCMFGIDKPDLQSNEIINQLHGSFQGRRPRFKHRAELGL